ncbi:MAG: hypothetical protein WC835_01995 [Candidatus Paceibacterota bacterium]|jgi:hypothetical protein
MKIQRTDEKIIRVTVSNEDFNLDEYSDDLIYLEKRNILTFGDTNFRVLEKFFLKHGYSPESLNLCFDDDKSIGLEMPKTWYLNKGKHALSIAAYYNYLNFHGIVENKNLETFNKKIVKDYGRIACIEVYFEKELKQFLDTNKIKYFGTPRTLTECVRYLEGWDLEKYPRLKGYATFSKFIEFWSRLNFPHFNVEEWHLGKEKSNKINKNGLTNVRKAVRYFWENHLINARKNISAEDIEIDILGGDKFHKIRQPELILMSEDLFSKDNSDCEIFVNLTRRLSREKIFFSKKKNNFAEKNAKAARAIYPNAIIVLIENDMFSRRNFSLMNPIKQSLNEDVVVATKVLRQVLEAYFKS